MAAKKIGRLSTIVNAEHLTAEQFVAQLNPRLQVQSLVKVIYEFFKRPDVPNAGLRLALWMKEPSMGPDTGLSVAYSWDGERETVSAVSLVRE
jgi:hypothetical protein